ncbi:MAG: hypothetical protein ABSG90_12950 [Dehalococcoidia bacterium]|jgi:hypothetical protein
MVVQKEINHPRFIVTVMAACAVSLLAIMISKYDIETSLAVALGSFISTLAAFRWFWSTRYGWGHYLVSIRPLFQTVSYILVILGPLPALAGVHRFFFYPGAMDYYWYLYLMAPLAFIFYEVGYELSLGKMTRALHRISPQTLAVNSNIITFTLYIFVILFFIHFTSKYGIDESGISSETMKQGLGIKALFYLYDGLLGACLFLITTKWLKCDPKNKLLFIIMGLTLFGIVALSSARTRAVTMSAMCFAAFQLSNNNKFYKSIKYLLMIPILFILTTAIRQGSFMGYHKAGISVTTRAELIAKALQNQKVEAGTEKRIKIDYGFRVNGIEWAGALLRSHDTLGTPFMWGENFFWAAYEAVPGVFLPFPKRSSEDVTNLHFKLPVWDPSGFMIASAVADGGFLGIIIGYLAVGFFTGTLWRYAASPKTPQYAKLACLALIPGLMRPEPLGTYIFMNIRHGILFAFLFWILITVGKLFFPPTRYKRFFLNKHLLETNPGD